MKRRSILPFVMTLAACAVLDAPLAQLERWQKQHAQPARCPQLPKNLWCVTARQAKGKPASACI